MAPNPEKERRRNGLLKQRPYLLGAVERRGVENAIREVCRVRAYALVAINVRTNHVHLVVSNSGDPERMMDSFKAYATRALRASGLVGKDQMLWGRHGSTRYLWSEEHVGVAVAYVVNGQGNDLPIFD
jgi:REP element-mobilizing transposase RayT